MVVNTQHHIRTGTARPIKQRVRRLSPFKRAGVEIKLNRMLQMGVIEPSAGEWASPIILVPKKDGSMRFCADYRALNEVTIKDVYPIPRIDDILEMLSGSEYFCTLDLASGY